jgi:hypothetical protein
MPAALPHDAVSQKAMAAICAAELRQYGVAAVAITPGFL